MATKDFSKVSDEGLKYWRETYTKYVAAEGMAHDCDEDRLRAGEENLEAVKAEMARRGLS